LRLLLGCNRRGPVVDRRAKMSFSRYQRGEGSNIQVR